MTADERLEALEAENAQLRGAIHALERGVAAHKPINLRRAENADLAQVIARSVRDGEREIPAAALTVLAPVLKRAREQHGVSLEVVAERSHVDVATLARIEAADPGPNWAAVRAVAFMLGIDMGESFIRVETKQVTGQVA
jgi:ribosome-binding protein aMBF1 (putative translation factor)